MLTAFPRREVKILGHTSAVLVAATLAAPAAWGHHSNVIFDTGTVVAFEGTVTRFDWTNPHVYINVETTDETGEPTEWLIETDATPILTRGGWTAGAFSPGEVVTVRGNPDRNPERHHLLLVSIGTQAGAVLRPRAGGRASTVRAADISGVWDALRGMLGRRFAYGALTEKGAAAQAAYHESMNPTSQCIPFPLPTIVAAPYLYEIEILEDKILIRTELFNVERTVYMDGRGHPENAERTNQGHSIGHWEGDVLVVDTTLFSDNRAGNRSGLPAGAQKHVVERYELSEDRTQLMVEFVVEDPEYLAEPMTGGIVWDYAPDRELSQFSCDPENAKRYTFE